MKRKRKQKQNKQNKKKKMRKSHMSVLGQVFSINYKHHFYKAPPIVTAVFVGFLF